MSSRYVVSEFEVWGASKNCVFQELKNGIYFPPAKAGGYSRNRNEALAHSAQNNRVAQDNDTENENDLNKGRPQGHAPTVKTIGDMMDAFKSITTVEYIRGIKTWGWQTFAGKLWQRNYYEHIIRNEQSTATLAPQPNLAA